MTPTRTVISVLLALVFAHSASADAPFEGKKSQWNGFDKYDFTCDGKPAIVVTPKKAADGNPWLWRGEFFGAFATVDQALLEKGWHVAYLACPNTFGSPETMGHWEKFYDLLTGKHALGKKPVLLGMSRGGLYVYRWAALHPDKVGLIYGDAPVCDTKSWPGGKNRGKGSANDWKLFQKAFNLTEEQALAFKGNPVDLEILEPIAKAKIPVIHVVGDADDVVPVAENTAILKANYEKLGGHVEVISKPGVGHHPHSRNNRGQFSFLFPSPAPGGSSGTFDGERPRASAPGWTGRSLR